MDFVPFFLFFLPVCGCVVLLPFPINFIVYVLLRCVPSIQSIVAYSVHSTRPKTTCACVFRIHKQTHAIQQKIIHQIGNNICSINDSLHFGCVASVVPALCLSLSFSVRARRWNSMISPAALLLCSICRQLICSKYTNLHRSMHAYGTHVRYSVLYRCCVYATFPLRLLSSITWKPMPSLPALNQRTTTNMRSDASSANAFLKNIEEHRNWRNALDRADAAVAATEHKF